MDEILSKIIIQAGGSVLTAIVVVAYCYYDSRRKNGNSKKDSNQDTEIAVIKKQLETYETNHFPTIERRFDKNEEEHKKMFDVLVEVKTKQDILLNR